MEYIILSIGGAFSPVHLMHIQTLKIARDELTLNKYNVLAGLLVPSSDDYCKDKLGEDFIPLKDRVEMCKLAVSHDLESDKKSPWMGVFQKGWGSSVRAAMTVANWLSHLFPASTFSVGSVCGADMALRCHYWRHADEEHPMVCIGRPAVTEELMATVPPSALAGVGEEGGYFFVVREPPGSEDVSSTAVREWVRRKQWDEMLKCVAPAVVEYLQKHNPYG